ncbi:MAG: hypothetical protein WC985_10540 [Thermoplasmata archaeon]
MRPLFALVFLAGCAFGGVDSTDTTAQGAAPESTASRYECVEGRPSPAVATFEGYPLVMECTETLCEPATWQIQEGEISVSCRKTWIEVRWVR